MGKNQKLFLIKDRYSQEVINILECISTKKTKRYVLLDSNNSKIQKETSRDNDNRRREEIILLYEKIV